MKTLVIAIEGNQLHEEALKAAVENIERMGASVYRAWIEDVSWRRT